MGRYHRYYLFEISTLHRKFLLFAGQVLPFVAEPSTVVGKLRLGLPQHALPHRLHVQRRGYPPVARLRELAREGKGHVGRQLRRRGDPIVDAFEQTRSRGGPDGRLLHR